MAADGSIIINVDLDDKSAQQELNRLAKRIKSLEDSISVSQKKKMPLLEQSKQLAAVLDEAKAKLYEMQQAPKGTFDVSEIAEQRERVRGLQTEWNRVQSAVERYDQKINDAAIEINWSKEKAGELATQIGKAGDNAQKMEKATKKANKFMGVFATRLRGIVLSAFVFNILSSGFRELTEWMGKVIKSNDEARGAIAKLKGALLTLAQPLVNVIIPVFTDFVNILARIVSEIAKVVSALFGTTAKASAEAAESLYDEMNAIEGVGDAAEKASGSLAAFDEINQLASENASSSSLDSDIIAPDFSGGLIGDLTFSLTDILFKWKNLTAEDILAKIVTALGAIAGGIIGFAIGGPGGAAIGIVVGAGLGLKLANVLFNGDGKLDTEEILRSLVTVLGAIAGGILGFTLGGIGGAAIGVMVGAGLGLELSKVLFNGDGKLDNEELVKSLVTALGAIAGGVIGFAVGGVGGAAIGVLVGAGIAVSITNGVFNGDGKLDTGEIIDMIVNALTVLAGGVIGFAIGGPAGALIGIAVGAGIVLTISELDAKGGKAADIASKFLGALIDALTIICGGIIGFAIGGPGGAIVGMVIAAGITFTLDNSSISFSGGSKGVVRGAGRDVVLGVEEGAEEEMSSIGRWLKDQIVDPFIEDFKTLFGIHSPSTVMAELGRYLMQGLKNGVASMIGSVTTDFASLKTNILNIFSSLWSGTKNVINQIIGGVEWMANKVIDGINAVIRAMNKVSFKMPSWLGGGSFGFNIGTLKNVSIPRLAEGAVIPPNREFLAVLGDQKSGTNIEAPLSTIEQAVENVLNRRGNSESVTRVALYLDGREIAKNQIKHINDMTRERGKPVLLF